MSANLEDPAMAIGMEKVNPHPSSQEGWYQRTCSQTIALISHASKVMLKILHARVQHYVNQELPDVQVRFRKGRGTRDQIANICWIMEQSKGISEKDLSLLHEIIRCHEIKRCLLL